jgi:hypothetical protein
MYDACEAGAKTATRRFHDQFKFAPGQVLYVKEPVYLTGVIGEKPPPEKVVYERPAPKNEIYHPDALRFTGVQYIYDNEALPHGDDIFWQKKNKLFCPEKAARRWVKIGSMNFQRLGDMTESDYRAEGLYKFRVFPVDAASYPMWRVDLGKDGVFVDADPAKVYAHLLNSTAKGKEVYDPEKVVAVYSFEWLKNCEL